MDLTCEPLTDNLTDNNLNEDLEREYQSLMAYLAHARARTGAPGQPIEDEREMRLHAALQQALTFASKRMEAQAGEPVAAARPS